MTRALETPRSILDHSDSESGCPSSTRSNTDASTYAVTDAFGFLEKEFDDVDVQLRWFRQSHTVGGWGTWRRLSDMQCRSLANRDDLGDGRVSIQHRDDLAATNRPQVLAQPGLQIGDSHLLHDLSMTRNSHHCQVRAREIVSAYLYPDAKRARRRSNLRQAR